MEEYLKENNKNKRAKRETTQEIKIEWNEIIKAYEEGIEEKRQFLDSIGGTVSTECMNEAQAIKKNVKPVQAYKLNYINKIGSQYYVGEVSADRPYAHSFAGFFYLKLKEKKIFSFIDERG